MRFIVLICFIFLVSLFGIDRKSFFKSIKSDKFIQISLEDYEEGYRYFFELLKNKNIEHKSFDIIDEKYYLVVKEKQKNGFGAYIIKQNGKHFLQMPHCRYDKYTCSIGWKLFFENNFKGAAFATAHRYNNQNSDLAHTKYSYFTAITKAYSTYDENGLIIQLHGFGKNSAKDVDIIVSSGSKKASVNAINIDKCLKEKGFISKLYGKEIYSLGGTTNSSNKLLKQMRYNHFIHLELSLDIRKKLLNSKSLRDKVAKCLK